MLVFEERGKPEFPEKNLLEQSREPTNSAHIWRRVRESNPGHIGGRQALSPLHQPCSPKEKVIIWLIFNPGLALTGFRTILPCFQQVNQTWARDPIEKPALGQRSTLKKHLTSMSCKLEPAIWSRDTGQRKRCYDRCQLIITWMSNIKEVHSKPRLHVSVNLLFGVWQPSCATPPSS